MKHYPHTKLRTAETVLLRQLFDTKSRARYYNGKTMVELADRCLIELRHHLDVICKMLNTEKDNLKIMSNSDFFELPHTKDKLIESVGLDGLPPITQKWSFKKEKDNSWKEEHYINLYENVVRYVIYTTYYDSYIITFVCLNKNDERKLFDYLEQTKRRKWASPAPILPADMLDDIIKNTIGFYERRKELKKFGVRLQRGVVLYGHPGDGKSMTTKYIKYLCLQKNIPFQTATITSINNAFGKNQLGELFNKKGITVFDDVDIDIFERPKDGAKACSLLSAMDGFDSKNPSIRIFTTNETLVGVDRAFLRPGRIDKLIEFKHPDSGLRAKLCERWPEEIHKNVDMKLLLEKTDGMSFAELENIRTNLVLEFFNSGTWDLETAFIRRLEKPNKGKVGFGSQPV